MVATGAAAGAPLWPMTAIVVAGSGNITENLFLGRTTETLENSPVQFIYDLPNPIPGYDSVFTYVEYSSSGFIDIFLFNWSDPSRGTNCQSEPFFPLFFLSSYSQVCGPTTGLTPRRI